MHQHNGNDLASYRDRRHVSVAMGQTVTHAHRSREDRRNEARNRGLHRNVFRDKSDAIEWLGLLTP
jgi:hypothetical protein